MAMSFQMGEYRRALEVVAQSLRPSGPDFPGEAVTAAAVALFAADSGGAVDVDLVGTASRRWADSLDPLPLDGDFHQLAVDHPLVAAYRRSMVATPLRLSDVPFTELAKPSDLAPRRDLAVSHVLTIPLEVDKQHISALALLRAERDFSPEHVLLAERLQPILTGVGGLHIQSEVSETETQRYDSDVDTALSARELAVLDLMSGGLVAAAIARRLSISPRTVGKHIENIYRKLHTHDRTSAILRAQAIGYLRAPLPWTGGKLPAGFAST